MMLCVTDSPEDVWEEVQLQASTGVQQGVDAHHPHPGLRHCPDAAGFYQRHFAHVAAGPPTLTGAADLCALSTPQQFGHLWPVHDFLI